MNKTPIVTIGLPFFNPGPFFIDCLKSVFAQSINDWELILVNDGSTDDSLDIALSIKDPRVKVISDGENRGLVYRLNQITKMANGKYLARMDADDIMHPTRIERQVEYLENHPEVDVVDTAALILNLNGDIVGIRGLYRSNLNAYVALKYGVVIHASIMGKHKWFIDNPYDEKYPRAEDRELFVRLFKSSKIGHIADPLYFYHYAGNVRIPAFKESYKSERKVIRNYGPKLIGVPLSTYLLIRSFIKSIVLKPLVRFNMGYWITNNIYSKVPDQIMQEGLAIKEIIYNTSIPSFSSI